MKKYVFTKGAEKVTVETDGLGTIDNFIVTGVLGKDYVSLIEAGFNLRMGDTVSSSTMMNIAKKCECRVDCYEGNQLVIDESVDFTSGEPELAGTISGMKVGLAYDEKTYNSEVPAEYVEEYDYETSKKSLPWLVVSYQKLENAAGDAEESEEEEETKEGGDTMELQIFANDRQLEFGGTSANAGTVSADKKTLTIKAKSWVMFEIKNDLGVLRPELVTWFTARIVYSGRAYEARCFVTPNTI